MADRSKEFPKRLSAQITEAMNDRLEQVARGRDEAKAEVVRAALRAYLDEQEDLIGSRKHFTKAFGRRVDYVEQLIAIAIWSSMQTFQLLYERAHKEKLDLTDLMAESISEGLDLHATLAELVEIFQQKKTKPPA
jgi:predicted DNA-binding protein